MREAASSDERWDLKENDLVEVLAIQSARTSKEKTSKEKASKSPALT